MKKELIDLYAVMQHIPEITGMDLVWRNNAWEGRYYLTGERHAYKRDKLRIKLWKSGTGCSIWLHEQGGPSMSLQQWLQSYGGAADWREAINIIRGNSKPNATLLNIVRNKGYGAKFVETAELVENASFYLHHCPLFVWMSKLFGEERTAAVWKRYNVTTDNNGYAVFWYTDNAGRVCYDKRMKYGNDGHRDKSFGGTRRFTTAKGYTCRPLFGEHLIQGEQEINVLESEKSVLIASCRYPDKLFVGTGGKNNLSRVEDNMILYPDMDAIEYWSSRKDAKICEWWIGDTAIGEHDDFADKIVREIWGTD